MIKKINVLLGCIVLLLISLIMVWYLRNGKSTYRLYRTARKMNEASSYEIDTTIDIETEVELLGKKEVDSTVLIETKVVKRPQLRVKQDYRVQILNMTPTLTTHYLIKEDHQYNLYTKKQALFSDRWTKKIITINEIKQRTSLELLGILMMASREIKINRISNDYINGEDVTELDVILHDEDTKKLVRSVLSAMSEEPLSNEINAIIEEVLNNEVLNVFIYIDKNTTYINRIEFELTRIMSKLLEEDEINLNGMVFNIIKNSSSQYMDLNRFDVEMNFKNYNKTDFIVPEFE
ncbi:hypothetical protein [Haloplasma contractile]|uniref:Uncharacterized protein n=1 Tax=Haloplasma contractile SSD-17B TaxID=1033810 RepID=U2FI51_9MOLU|nr:hypothetical protein [Haloplasma contractile]ERJ10894.1 hypothetical protein HLPCO_003139 [Haloplasma contractile SSD-17B]